MLPTRGAGQGVGGTGGAVAMPAETAEATDSEDREVVERYPDGRIPASGRYIDYDGQVIVRTRYGTHQRWVSEGWPRRRFRRGVAPYILGKRDCRPRDGDRGVMNSHLSPDEYDVYYVDDSETVRYRVANKRRRGGDLAMRDTTPEGIDGGNQ